MNSQGYSDFPDTLGGYQDAGLERNQFFGLRNFTFDMGVIRTSDSYGEAATSPRSAVSSMTSSTTITTTPVVGSADFAEVSNVNVAKGAMYSGAPQPTTSGVTCNSRFAFPSNAAFIKPKRDRPRPVPFFSPFPGTTQPSFTPKPTTPRANPL